MLYGITSLSLWELEVKYRHLLDVLFVMDGDERDCPLCAAASYCFYNNSIMKRFKGCFC